MPLAMTMEDIFAIAGRGTVVTGRIERGTVKVGEEIEIVGFPPDGEAGGDRGGDVPEAAGRGHGGRQRGIAAAWDGEGRGGAGAGGVEARIDHAAHQVQGRGVCIDGKEEGGRHTPFFTGYRPQFYFRTTDVTGDVKLPAGVEMVMPGDNVSAEISLITPVALEKGCASRFAKAATPSAPARSPKSSSNLCQPEREFEFD